MKTIVLTGGGTAGHIMPNIALIPELTKHFDRIIYVGTDGMEKKLIREIPNVEFVEIEAVKLVRKLTLKNLAIPYKLLKSIKQAKQALKTIQPNIIFSKGGYVSIPIAIAGKKLHIPIITHESDLSLGLANKIIARYSNLILTAFKETARDKEKFIYTGSPVREQIALGKAENIKFKLNTTKKTILFFGGSLGAKAINEVVYNSINNLTEKYNVLHITGKGKFNKNISAKNYHQIEYTNHIEDYFAIADFVIARAGANSMFELFSILKPTLFIPLPKSESRGDQIENANYFYNKGMCEILLQENLNSKNLIKYLNILEKNEKIIKNNIKNNKLFNPNKKIVEIICDTAK